MKRLLTFLAMSLGLTALASAATSYKYNPIVGNLDLVGTTFTITTADLLTVSTLTVTSSATISGAMTASNASNVLGGNGAALTSLTAANISAGSLGASVKASSVAVNSVNDNAIVAVSGSKITGTIANTSLDNSSVTLQGNTFNAASKLVQLDGTTKLPAVDGSALTSITAANISAGLLGASVQASSVAAASVGLTQLSIVPGQLGTSNAWTQGNTFSNSVILNSIAVPTGHAILVSSNNTTTEMMAVDGNGVAVFVSTVVIGTVTTTTATGAPQNPGNETMQIHNLGVRTGIRMTTAGSGATNSDGIFYGLDASNGYMAMAETRALIFQTNGTTRMTILSGGNMGIGNTTALTKLHMSSGAILLDGAGAGLTIGKSTDTVILRHLSGTASLDFGATAAGTCDSLTITINGAADADTVYLGIPNALATADVYQSFQGFVSAVNTVTVKRCNLTNAVTALTDAAAATVRADVWQH